MGSSLKLLSSKRTSFFAAVAIIIVQNVHCDLVLDKNFTRTRRSATWEGEMGMGCDFPKMDPFAPELLKLEGYASRIVCTGTNWVSCQRNECRVRESILKELIGGVVCTYRDILLESDHKYTLGKPTEVLGGGVYRLVASDHAEVSCFGNPGKRKWEGVVIGFREVRERRPPPGHESAHNILVLAFDSTSKNGFIRRMPLSYKVLQDELGAVILNGYNIVGDATVAALFPILTGHTEEELPGARRLRVGSGSNLETVPFIWYPLTAAGYRTAYFEDSPGIGTFQLYHSGFTHQPTDHYMRAFFKHYHMNLKRFARGNGNYCIGDTPSHALMLNITRQFIKLDSPRKFVLNFIVDISHDNFTMISNADERLVHWLHALRDEGILSNTTLVVMGDHGPRYSSIRPTLQGKQEERLPLMALVVAKRWVLERPEAMRRLRANADVLTTPFDVHSTLLELGGLHAQRVPLVLPGAVLPRSMSLFDKIPANRSCAEAGVESHWCTCIKWENVQKSDEMYLRAPKVFVDFINELTREVRSKCAVRTLTSIESVLQRKVNPRLLTFKRSRNYVISFDERSAENWRQYQIQVIVGPGASKYEASMSYNTVERKFRLKSQDISRINRYNDEPRCVSATRPDLNKYCYCKVQ